MMAIDLTDFDKNVHLEFQDIEKRSAIWSLVSTIASDD